jgi:hypothetical protein
MSTCFGCGAQIEEAPGNYYCGPCVEAQTVAFEAEREAFEAYHRFADAVARGEV